MGTSIRFCGLVVLVVAAWLSVVPMEARAQGDEPDYRPAVVLLERPREGGLPPEIGAGFFVSQHGHILTAAHVLLESNEGDAVVARRPLNVRLFNDPLPRAARILMINRLTDVALLKIKADGETPFLPLGESRSVEGGDLLTLIGHPLGRQEWTVSAGLVDSVTALERIFMQATLVKGQSGGPAIDEAGAVVGIASYRDEGAHQSYLVPINDAATVLGGGAANAPVALSDDGSRAPPAPRSQPGGATSGEEREPNDFASQANVVVLGSTVRGQLSSENEDLVDHIRFDSPAGVSGTIRAIVRHVRETGSVFFIASIFDSAGVNIAGQRIDEGSSYSVELEPSESYMVSMRAKPFSGGWSNVYEVTLQQQ